MRFIVSSLIFWLLAANVFAAGPVLFRDTSTKVTTRGKAFLNGAVLTVGDNVVTTASLAFDTVGATKTLSWVDANNYLDFDATIAADSLREMTDETVSSTTHSASAGISHYYFDSTSASIVSTLPAIGTAVRGALLYFSHEIQGSTNTVTIQRNGSDTIGGGTSVLLSSEGDIVTLRCPSSGTDWKILSISNIVTSAGELPSGTVMTYAGSSTPSGWLFCNGSAISRSTYANLFAAIGTTWGIGDNFTTFNIPDLRGRAIIGVGQGSGLTNRTLAQNGGAETHQLSTTEMPSHVHTGDVYASYGSQTTWYGGGPKLNSAATSWTSNAAGSDGAHNNMQPWAAVNYIIKE